MKKIVFPPPVLIGDKFWNSADIIREVILTRPGCRRPGSVKVAVAIGEKLNGMDEDGKTLLVVSDREHEVLVEEGALKGDVTISPPTLNHYYLKVLSAIYDAEVVQDT